MPPAGPKGTFQEGPRDAWEILELAESQHKEVLAIVDQDKTLTYGDFAERARSVAAWLLECGVRRGDAIAICSRNSSFVMELHYAAACIHAGRFVTIFLCSFTLRPNLVENLRGLQTCVLIS